MADTSAGRAADDIHHNGQTSAREALAELRRRLLGPEQSQLGELQARVETLAALKLNAEAVSRVLPEAVVHRSQQDHQLTRAFVPTVAEAIQESVNRDPQRLVDAIFPVMGPAIRKAIAAALQGMVQSLNQTLEYSVSPRGWRWRLEAWRTGKTFAEIVLLRSLVYRVEQVFLIHRDSGLLLQHVSDLAAGQGAPDLISGMLTAIQDFVRDSFQMSQHDALETFQVGELTVWVESGPQAFLAAVIRGAPPHGLHAQLQDALASICLEQHEALTAFTGHTEPFEASRPHLEACLVAQAHEPTQRAAPFLWLWALLIVALLSLGGWFWTGLREHRRWTDYLERLRAEPGIVVTSATRQRGRYRLAGLRDPLAADPATFVAAAGLQPEQVVGEWEPYLAMSPAFVLTRAERILRPPASVALRLEHGVLHAAGAASQTWIAEARLRAPVIPGVSGYQDTELIDVEAKAFEAIKRLLAPPATVTLHFTEGVLSATGSAPHAWIQTSRDRAKSIAEITRFQADELIDLDLQQWRSRRERIESAVLLFTHDAEIRAAQEETFQQLLQDVRALYQAAQALGRKVSLTIVGHTDSIGSDADNLRLSQRRADRVRDELMAAGLEGDDLVAVGVGVQAPLRDEITAEDRAWNRSVSFRVTMTDARHGEGPLE